MAKDKQIKELQDALEKERLKTIRYIDLYNRNKDVLHQISSLAAQGWELVTEKTDEFYMFCSIFDSAQRHIDLNEKEEGNCNE